MDPSKCDSCSLAYQTIFDLPTWYYHEVRIRASSIMNNEQDPVMANASRTAQLLIGGPRHGRPRKKFAITLGTRNIHKVLVFQHIHTLILLEVGHV